MSMTATVKDLRTIRYIPKPGEHQLSINLGLADAATVLDFARETGLEFEAVQIPTRQGIEIHALLLCQQSESLPFGSDLSDKLDELATKVSSAAIRHVYGRFKTA
ncbi:hypothetical protein AB3R30_04390 [Leptolyngbyaceae cyanobacterium UHCC 1019]